MASAAADAAAERACVQARGRSDGPLWQSMRPRSPPDREAGSLLKGFFRFHLRKTFISPFSFAHNSTTSGNAAPPSFPLYHPFLSPFPPPVPINGNESREKGGGASNHSLRQILRTVGRSVGRTQLAANQSERKGLWKGGETLRPFLRRERERKGLVCSETAEREERRAFPHMDPHLAPPVVLWCHYSPPFPSLPCPFSSCIYTASLGGGREGAPLSSFSSPMRGDDVWKVRRGGDEGKRRHLAAQKRRGGREESGSGARGPPPKCIWEFLYGLLDNSCVAALLLLRQGRRCIVGVVASFSPNRTHGSEAKHSTAIPPPLRLMDMTFAFERRRRPRQPRRRRRRLHLSAHCCALSLFFLLVQVCERKTSEWEEWEVREETSHPRRATHGYMAAATNRGGGEKSYGHTMGAAERAMFAQPENGHPAEKKTHVQSRRTPQKGIFLVH